MMPKRMSKGERRVAVKFLAMLHGKKCSLCPEADNLQLDHIDGNDKNNEPENWRLLCPSCNVLEARRLKNERQNGTSAQPVIVATAGRASTNGHSHQNGYTKHFGDSVSESVPKHLFGKSESIRELVDSQNGSTEVRLNEHYEMPWVYWMRHELEQRGRITKDHAIYAGALEVGASSVTTTRYLRKWTAAGGPFMEQKDSDTKQKMVMLRVQAE